MVSAAKTAVTETVRYRTAPNAEVSSVALTDTDPDVLAGAFPWREFRWYSGQKHYSGTYWSATESRHVIYESRLELARLLYADFDRSVQRICAQPFLLSCVVNNVERKHIPDYFLMTTSGPKVVDVKPARRLSVPEVVSTFEWTRSAIERRGWMYEVWSEPCAVELHNVRFLAGYRRRNLFDPALLTELHSTVTGGLTIGEVIEAPSAWSTPQVRSALFHLLWSQEFVTDLRARLSPRLTLQRGG